MTMLSKLLAAGLGLLPLASGATNKPNILFILTDDQDYHMESVEHMPFLNKHIIDQGTTFDNHYCTVAICCPSRANLWTGKAAHNTNVTDVKPPFGGYPQIIKEGWHDNFLPIWIQELGYNTYYTGKLWNAHTIDNYNDPYVRGFNGSDFLLDPYTYRYWNAQMTRNGAAPVAYDGQYSPDVIAQKAYDFLEEATSHQEPWFLTVAPIAPHSEMVPQTGFTDQPRYHPRHAHLFKDYKIPRTESFNPDEQPGVAWMKKLRKLNETVIDANDEYQRARLRSLQAVDEMIDGLFQRLEDKGLLDDTYIIYSTDNGFHISTRRMLPGKECSYEEDINIPFFVRGPGVPQGLVSDAVSSHTDVAPTILKLAGGSKDDFDGVPIPLSTEDLANLEKREHVQVEFWGYALPESVFNADYPYGTVDNKAANNTYKSLRLIGDDYSLFYSVWCSGEHEFYDLHRDPAQVHNYFDQGQNLSTVSREGLASEYQLAGRSFELVVDRLDALLMVLKSCKGEQCYRPWKTLHPSGNVQTLHDALAADFDDFYSKQTKIRYNSCQMGYLPAEEGPQDVNQFDANFYSIRPQDSDSWQRSYEYNVKHWSHLE
ncbi:Arylsulfatase A or related enzyme [Geosmithia morbida]|uniref:Arylsulfatase n=1 Tax=Geosmithia morbida TaxID=1094350 RepID=A0A9P5CZS6_9HYPO|nr:Arylsulfatase A or related enzyme [Geosmithia morbida]KAF4120842.1 Arylsulfatase A or related enzyme [Geosmithia morbida]